MIYIVMPHWCRKKRRWMVWIFGTFVLLYLKVSRQAYVWCCLFYYYIFVFHSNNILILLNYHYYLLTVRAMTFDTSQKKCYHLIGQLAHKSNMCVFFRQGCYLHRFTSKTFQTKCYFGWFIKLSATIVQRNL